MERPRVFQAFLMKGRMFCGDAGAAWVNACDTQANSRTKQIRDRRESGKVIRIENCMTPDYSLWLIILQRALDFQLGAHLLDALHHQRGHAVAARDRGLREFGTCTEIVACTS